MPSFPAAFSTPKVKVAAALIMFSVLAFFMAAAAVRAWTEVPTKGQRPSSLPAIGAVTTGALAFWAGKELFDKTPLLQVDEEGIRCKHEGYGLIAWSDIAAIELAEPQAAMVVLTSYLVLVPKSADQLIRNMPSNVQQKATSSNAKYGGPTIDIHTLPFPPKDLVAAIRSFAWPRISGQPHSETR